MAQTDPAETTAAKRDRVLRSQQQCIGPTNTPDDAMKYVDLPDQWRPVVVDDDDDDADIIGRERCLFCRKCQIRRRRGPGTTGWVYQKASEDLASFEESALGFEIEHRWPKFWYLCAACYQDRNRLLTDDEARDERRRRQQEERLVHCMLRWRFQGRAGVAAAVDTERRRDDRGRRDRSDMSGPEPDRSLPDVKPADGDDEMTQE